MIQLSLFDWDLVVTGNGYESLARLDFEDARKCFHEVLARLPDHPKAQKGVRDLRYWDHVITEITKKETDEAPRFLWRTIGEFSFDKSEHSRNLRARLITLLLSLLQDEPTFYEPPDLCSGYLYLQLGNYQKAANHLRPLVRRLPQEARVQLFLAESLYLQGKTETAGPHYAKALLSDPAEISTRTVSNESLVAVIEEYGAAQAPLYGFLAGVLPLVEHPCASGAIGEIYQSLREAERAGRDGDHRLMVAARRRLKDRAPEFFQEYRYHLEKEMRAV